MGITLIATTGTEPVTLAEIKEVCGVDADITAHDTLLPRLAKAARRECEHLLDRTIVAATYELIIDAFPEEVAIQLAWPHVTGITSLQYMDENEVLQTMSSSLYTLDSKGKMPGWVLPAYGTEWPTTLNTANAVRVTFTTRWIEGGNDEVAENVRDWILARTATAFKFREQIAAGVSISELPRGFADGKLDGWRIYY